MDSSLTTDAEALLNRIPATQLGDPNHWGKVSRNPRVIKMILALSDAGKTQTEIAQIVGISQPEVSRTLAEYTPVMELAKRRIDAAQLQAVEGLIDAIPAAVKKGLHGPQVALLEAGGLIKTQERGTQVLVQIGAGAQDVQIGIQLGSEPPSLVPRSDLPCGNGD